MFGHWDTARMRGSGRRRLAVAAAGLALAACGDDPPKHDEKKPAAAPAAPGAPGAPGGPAAGGVPGAENYIVLGENKNWKPLKPLFEAYQAREVAGLTDFSLANLVQFIEKPIPPSQTCPPDKPDCDKSELVEKPTEIELDDTCATKAPLERYSLIILMSGIPTPKAVLTDGTGSQCEVIRGDGLGNEGGRVTAITQYKLIVNQPGKDKPVVLSIAPPISVDEEAPDQSEPL
ncbi:MAG: hypothetical protein FJ100_18575 [Deltaproteobacteria bacterium]|nr:hypothetical protein [Deltaproteobacteria bacterium]